MLQLIVEAAVIIFCLFKIIPILTAGEVFVPPRVNSNWRQSLAPGIAVFMISVMVAIFLLPIAFPAIVVEFLTLSFVGVKVVVVVWSAVSYFVGSFVALWAINESNPQKLFVQSYKAAIKAALIITTATTLIAVLFMFLPW